MSFRSCLYLGVFSHGLRRFICNEDFDTLEVARRRYRLNVFILFNDFTQAISIRRRMTILHYLLMSVIYAILAFFAYQILDFYGLVDDGIDFISRTKAAFVRMKM